MTRAPVAAARNTNTAAEGKTTMRIRWLIEEVTRGLAQDIALRQRYQKEDFGLESAFGNEKQARARISEFKQTYGLKDGDIRLVQNISRVGAGERITWQVFVKDGKGIRVRFFD